ncbi:MAG: AI-2E family transporter [Verrucomicrobiota bacterium]
MATSGIDQREMATYPTNWQKKILWAALTALAMTFIGVLAAGAILGTSKALGFLQPILVPVAVAGLLAYLLDPLVNRFVGRGFSRTQAVLAVFALVFVPLALITAWVVPQIYDQSSELAKALPGDIERGKTALMGIVERYQARYAGNEYVQQATDWIQHQLPTLPPKIWQWVSGGLQGFLGIFGLLFGLILVPIYLYFFLINAGKISEHWSDYLPLRASPFKDEVVDCLNEINSYLIAFFRGQILVTMIDGALLGLALFFLGLKFALVIGLMVAVLQLIPYLGVIVCWIPAMLIAFGQWGFDWHAIAVTVIFFVVTHLDGLFIAPRIVGESVGLHPMTIIVSVFAWGLLVGGLLGALLAVPLTASLKVLLRRYVWQRRFKAPGGSVPVRSAPSPAATSIPPQEPAEKI